MRFRFTLFLSFVLAACSRQNEEAVTVIVLDAGRGAAQVVRSATAEGFVGLDEQGRVVPALADRWIVTDDGQSYIFRLRDGTWADGTPLTGETARAALRQALGELKGGALAHDFAAVDEVRAMAGRVVEIRLTHPVPEFLQLLAQPELGLTRRGRGTGPMAQRRDGEVTVLTPIAPEKRGLPAVKDWAGQVRTVRLSAGTVKQALDRFDEDNGLVVLGGTFIHWPALADARVPRSAIRLDPVVGLFGLAPVHGDGFLGAAENREAVAMAIDRDALAQALQAPGWAGTTRIVSPATEGASALVAERWTGLSPAQRQATAAARVARWRSRHGDFTLRLALPHGLGADVLFARLSTDLTAAGFKVERVGEGDVADLRLVDAVAPYSRAGWFFAQLSCAARPKVCSAGADASYASAMTVGDPAARAAQMAQAEAELMAANTFIPLGPPLRWSLAASDTTGFSANRWGIHPLLPLAMRSAR
ncbi:MAG: transporter substrate-binding protein [Novosphingobium sp.]|nr:transporter substrate-binding protein [Novosphingobium sp.]